MSNITSNIGQSVKDSMGGVERVYLFPFVNNSFSSIVLDGQELVTFPATTLFSLHSVSTNFSENIEIEGGSVAWNQSFSVEFHKVTLASEVYKFSFKDYSAIYIDRNGNIRILGLYNGLEGQIEQSTGTGKPDFNGYRVSFSGKEDNQAYYITNLIAAGFTIHTTENYIFEDGCNYVFENGDNYIFE